MNRFITLAFLLFLFSCSDNSDKTGKINISDHMKETHILKVRESASKLIGQDWMAITAGDMEKFNSMTASWGGLGDLWGKHVAYIFVRPQRYTYEFLENSDYFTLTFFEDDYKDALNILGSKSGRNSDKINEAKLTPIKTDNSVAFSQGKLVIECKKLYADFLNPQAFIDTTIISKTYPNSDFHKMYVGEIVKVWQK